MRGLRKLAAASGAFSAAVFASYYLVPSQYLLYVAAACAVLSLAGLFVRGDARRRVLLFTLAAAAGFAVSAHSYGTHELPARSISEKELTIEARVTDYPDEFDSYTRVNVKLTGDSTPKLGAVINYYDEKAPDLSPGDVIRLKAYVRAADTRFGKPYSGLNAGDVWLVCYPKGETEIVCKSGGSLRYFPKQLAREVEVLAQKVFYPSAVALMTGLLTGDTKLLYADVLTYSQMAQAGILHVVAVSGMNVAFLVAFIRMLVRRKKTASIVSMIVVLLFVPFAGATPPVVRAAFMYLFVLAAPLLRRQSDSITSLTAVLAVMLLLNPDACASVSLQLTFAATLGILIVTPAVYRKLKTAHSAYPGGPGEKVTKLRSFGRRALSDVDASFAATIGAIVFSTPVSALYFGYVSIIGILVNLLIFWAISAAFLLGYFACAFGALWLPLGKAAGAVTSVFACFILGVVRAAAKVPYGAVYTNGNVFGWWLVAVYAIFILFYILRGKKGFRFVTPACIAASTLCCLIVFTEISAAKDPGSFTALDVGQGESLVLTAGKTTAVVDCGGKGKLTNAGDTASAWLLCHGRSTVDVLALTHFDDDHVNGAERLMARCKVRCLVIPDKGEEHPVREKILAMAEKRGVQVYIIKEDTEIRAGDFVLDTYADISQGQDALLFLEKIGDFAAFIPGDTTISDEERFLKTRTLPDAEVFVAGHHGSKNASGEALLSALHAEYAVVSSGYNTYGHPTKEALSRFDKAGMRILRTDMLGNITIPADGKERSDG